jgi:hypothetical protein
MFTWTDSGNGRNILIDGNGQEGCFSNTNIELKGVLSSVDSALQKLEISRIGERTGDWIIEGRNKRQGQKLMGRESTGIPQIGSTVNQGCL